VDTVRSVVFDEVKEFFGGFFEEVFKAVSY